MRIIFVSVVFFLTGCSGYDSNSFNDSAYSYEDLKSNEPVQEIRVFVINDSSGSCPLQSTSETPAALIPIAVWGAKEVLAFGKTQLEKKAEYLESDIKLAGKLTLSGNWPPTTIDKKTGLCVLLVAGSFSANSSGRDALERFRQSQRPNLAIDGIAGFEAIINQYKLPIPSRKPIVGAFSGLTKDPAFVLEARISASRAQDGTANYVIAPTYLFYPVPLHKLSTKNSPRALSASFTFADATASLSFDKFQSGSSYETAQLQTRYAVAQSVSGEAFGALGVVVTEGPDKAPTAKVLRDIAAQEANLNAYIDTKAAEKLARIKAEEDEKKAAKAKAAAGG